ncbi:MAG: CvpA family protein [Aestuariivirga sp.]|uniref:CvpA family protein n=1 Tax=Aestuariivirga sp. TaxID=2650926 RepID=UPI0025BD0738|nr:CvpA family protein [Aestuariivirga sp.]MCA3561771.1 CvpA family protein [Aestuariivirga sp.]
MPLTLLDFILIAIMLVSGLLALMRGFTREVLSLVAWGAAAVAAYFSIKQPSLVSWVQASVPYLEKENIAQIALGASAFLIVLIVISVISVKISDWVVDSAAGTFDRTLGFMFGVARGFIFVAIAYLFYGWLQPFDRQESWVRTAYSLPMIKSAGAGLLAFMPPDIADTLNNTALATGGGKTSAPGDAGQTDPGYRSNDSQQLDNLMESTGGGNDQLPAAGQDVGGNTGQPPSGQDNSQ